MVKNETLPQTEEMPNQSMPELEQDTQVLEETQAPIPHSEGAEIYLNPNAAKNSAGEAKTIGEQIQEDAQARGFGKKDLKGQFSEDLQGLCIDLEDGQRYIVRETSAEHAQETRTKKTTVLPHFEPGKRLPSWQTHETMYKKAGRPRWIKRGSERSLERRRVEIGQKEVPTVLVDVYDAGGDLVNTVSQRRDDLYALAGEHGIKSAYWGMKHEIADNRREYTVRLEAEGDRFEQMTEQLEAKGITNWEGLTWKRRPYEKGGKQALPKTLQGVKRRDGNQPEILDVVQETQEIIADRTIKERTYQGEGYKWSRVFVVRSTQKFKDGSTSVSNATLRDHELREQLEEPTDDLILFRDMHISRAVAQPAETNIPPRDPLERQHREEAIAWGGLVAQRGKDGEYLKDENGKFIPANKAARHETAVTADDEHIFKLPEGINRANERDKSITLEDALAVLSSPELYGNSDRDNVEFQDHIEQMKKGEVAKYGEELKKTLSEVGVDYFYEVVYKMHGEIYPMYESSAERLGLPVSVEEEASLSWMIEELMERSHEKRHDKKNSSPDPFMSILKTPHLLRDLVDQHVGEVLGRATEISDETQVKDGTTEDGKPKFKNETVHAFNDKIFERIPIMKDYSTETAVKDHWKHLNKWHYEKNWKPIKDQAHAVYKQLVAKDRADYKETEKLGRMLRRTIGQ